jgi:hypothetical protein
MIDGAIIAHLFSVAAALSGYPAIPEPERPLLRLMTPAALVEEVCPEAPSDCERLVALFDRERNQVLMRADLDLRDAADNSFLVHEFVHVLEARQKGRAYQHDCAETLRSEREAYRIQNLYLDREGRPERHGGLLAHRVCSPHQPGGNGTMTLEMAPAGPRDEQALDTFMQELSRRAPSSARRR